MPRPIGPKMEDAYIDDNGWYYWYYINSSILSHCPITVSLRSTPMPTMSIITSLSSPPPPVAVEWNTLLTHHLWWCCVLYFYLYSYYTTRGGVVVTTAGIVPTNNTYQHLRSEGRLDYRNIVEALPSAEACRGRY